MQPTLRFASLALCVLALSACDKPKPRDLNDQGGPLGASGATTAGGPAGTPAAATPAAKATTTAEPLPDLPKWAKSLMGQKINEAFPVQTTACVGNTDVVTMRYQGAVAPGTRIEGWGWDPAAKAAVQHILLVADDGQIVGAGETGLPRPDVTAARKEVTSPTVGWQAYTAQGGGGLYAFGLLGDGKTACRLGHINL
ncbi:MAG: hypothetical protein JWP49_2683 [Phenylobacterium sp.]|nr:hypothetical protein [Phenylobacterium sp.]